MNKKGTRTEHEEEKSGNKGEVSKGGKRGEKRECWRYSLGRTGCAAKHVRDTGLAKDLEKKRQE